VILTLKELVKDSPYSALKCQVLSVDFLITVNEQIQINVHLQNPHTTTNEWQQDYMTTNSAYEIYLVVLL
jgi:hypothetical protein